MVDNINGTIRLPKYPTTYIYGLSLHGASTKNATVSVRGNGKGLVLTNGSQTGTLVGNTYTVGVGAPAFGSSTSMNIGASNAGKTAFADYKALGVSTNASTSGLTGSVSISIPGNSYASFPCTYYIYVE